MKKFGVSISLFILVNPVVLVPKGLFTVQEVIDLLPEFIDVCPKGTITVMGGERVQGFLLPTTSLFELARFAAHL